MTEVLAGEDPPAGRGRSERIDLSMVIGRLRRAQSRAVRTRLQVEPLSEAHLELVRLIELRPGVRVTDAAAELILAPNTVSTLVARLVEADLVQRNPDPNDGRGSCLTLTPAATAQIAAWREHSASMVAQALSRLDAHDGAAIEAAIPALWRLSRVLENVGPP